MYNIKTTKVDHLKKLINKEGVFNRIFSNSFFAEFMYSTGIEYRQRSITPDILLWGFINQILDENHSCRYAVATIIAKLKIEGKKIISSATGAYCQARSKLPEKFFSELAKALGKKLDKICTNFTWKEFEVKLIDGSTLSLPITNENRKEFTQAHNSTGLLKCRILGIFSLGHAGLLDLAIGPCVGKGTGEVSLLRSLYANFKEGELALADRIFCTYFDMANFMNRNVAFVFRKHSSMKSDFRTGESLGKHDHIIELLRPWNRSNSITVGEIKQLPPKIKVREVEIKIAVKGFRVKSLWLITSLLDPFKYKKEDLAELYLKRYNVEVDFRSIKIDLKMDVLRCKSPAMVRKEIWMHMITYNYLRAIIIDGAIYHGVNPRDISFKEALCLLKSFRPYLSFINKKIREEVYITILASLKTRIGKRPYRIEPRLVRHCTMRYGLLKKTRAETKYGYWKDGDAWIRRKKELKKRCLMKAA